MNNLELWNKVQETPIEHTKKVTTRGGFTAINATFQIKQATELWGPYGSKWGVKNLGWEYLQDKDKIVEVCLNAIFYSPACEFEISSCMAYKPGDDHRKKLLTDLTTKSLSKLGFSADVFMGMYDDNKYIEELKKKEASKAVVYKTDDEFKKIVAWIRKEPLETNSRIEYTLKNATLTDVQKNNIETLRTPLVGTEPIEQS
jgi:hypothetical protein